MLTFELFSHLQIKLWKKMMFRLTHITVVNACIIYNQSQPEGGRKITQQDFILDVITELLGEATEKKLQLVASSTRKAAAEPSSSSGSHHWVDRLKQPEPEGGKRRRNEKACVVCTRVKGKRSMTFFYCPDCPGQPGLHPECFTEFHAKLYKN